MNWINLDQHLSIIRVSGPDARTFLHAQLTCDLEQRPHDSGSLGACLTAKGKVIGSFLVLPDGDDLLLAGHPGQAPSVVAHLSRFVLRARVTLTEDAERWIAGSLDDAVLPEPGSHLDLSSIQADAGGVWLVGDGRFLSIGQTEADSNGLDRWQLFDLRQGLVLVNPDQADRFIPQMLNLDTLGGVSFRKGCYPGQEIVARARNLGRVKRGLAWLACDQALAPGEKLHDEDGAVAGEIIEVVLPGSGISNSHEALAVCRVDGPTLARLGDTTVSLVRFGPGADQGSATM